MLYVGSVLVSFRPLELRISDLKKRTSHFRFSDPNAFSRAFSERVSLNIRAVLRRSSTDAGSQSFNLCFPLAIEETERGYACTGLPTMIRQDYNRIDPKRRSTLDYKKKQFASATFKVPDYPHRLNLYRLPPTAEITLEQFEQWAIDRLRSMYCLPPPRNPSFSSTSLSGSLTRSSPRRIGSMLVSQQDPC